MHSSVQTQGAAMSAVSRKHELMQLSSKTWQQLPMISFNFSYQTAEHWPIYAPQMTQIGTDGKNTSPIPKSHSAVRVSG